MRDRRAGRLCPRCRQGTAALRGVRVVHEMRGASFRRACASGAGSLLRTPPPAHSASMSRRRPAAAAAAAAATSAAAARTAAAAGPG